MTQFPAFLQSALLYNSKKPFDLDALVKQFLANEAEIGDSYNMVADTKPGVFYRLFSTKNVMVTVEYVDRPAHAPSFEAALGSPFTQIVTPDARQRIAAHRSHILIGVHHGAVPPTGEIGDLLKKTGVALPGSSLAAFQQRRSICWSLSFIANLMAPASLIHWTISDQLLKGETFAKIEPEPPTLLDIHPLLRAAGENAKGQAQIEIKTHGVGHFLGREIHVLPTPVPWPEVIEAIFAFVRLANLKNGYVVPDGDTFSPHDGSVVYRVRHIAEGERSGDHAGPLYQFELLFSRALEFAAPDYIPPERVFDDRNVPHDVAQTLGDKKNDAVQEWRAKRRMAEAAGNELQVKVKALQPGDETRLFGGLRRILPFGRKG